MLNFNDDFKGFINDDSLEGIHRNRETLKGLGLDPDADDTVFGAEYVYCGAHRWVHVPGACNVCLVLKRPLNATNEQDAKAEVAALGYPLR